MRAYQVRGHHRANLVVNNQIGFTTDPRFSRSTLYCTAIAKALNAPILHVNADDVEAVVFACQFAADYRKQYKKDVVIDMIGYRRHGHNEFDEPSFTQPRMYAAIRNKKKALDIYTSNLLEQQVVSPNDVRALHERIWKSLEDAYEKSKSYESTSREWLTSTWPGFKSPKKLAASICLPQDTGIAEDRLRDIGAALVRIPQDFTLHKGFVKVMEALKNALSSKEATGIDMETAESLAFGTLLLEGNHVRLSGQDVERGTFSHRHAVLHDQSTNSEKLDTQYIPLAHLESSQAAFTVCNFPFPSTL